MIFEEDLLQLILKGRPNPVSICMDTMHIILLYPNVHNILSFVQEDTAGAGDLYAQGIKVKKFKGVQVSLSGTPYF